MKIQTFLKNLKEMLLFSKFYFKMLSKFWRSSDKYIDNLGTMHLQGVRGEAPRSQPVNSNISRKFSGILQILENFNEKFYHFSTFSEIFIEVFAINWENLRNFHFYWFAYLLKSQSKNQFKPVVFDRFDVNFAVLSNLQILSNFSRRFW